ncbi:MAG TPA: hypothetical protein VD813_03370 [Pseudonocardia sp.]|nr:hypothetical protein [Pseudonocardia sp.]
MYATLTRSNGSDPAPGGAPQQLRLDQIGGPGRLLLQLWPDRPDDPGAFEVRHDQALADAAADPAVASVLTFTGPVSEAVEEAGERAYRDRVNPGVAGHPGGVRMLSLWQPELRRQVVIVLATSVEAVEAGERRIGSLPLLPGEDVALLPGPDHVELFRVQR